MRIEWIDGRRSTRWSWSERKDLPPRLARWQLLPTTIIVAPRCAEDCQGHPSCASIPDALVTHAVLQKSRASLALIRPQISRSLPCCCVHFTNMTRPCHLVVAESDRDFGTDNATICGMKAELAWSGPSGQERSDVFILF